MLIAGRLVTVGISVGIAQFPAHGTDGRALLHRADQAMYQAKQGSRGFQMFSPDPSPANSSSVLLTSALMRAVANGELLLHYQPQIEIGSGRIVGKEALVRWQHPEQGMIAPNRFIPAAEKSPAIGALTHAVLRLALDQEQRWRAEGFEAPVSVNLSARLLDDDTLCGSILRLLKERHLPPESLILELTETALASSPAQARTALAQIAEAGIRISIDDFGAGYTSFRQLRELDIAQIKIDGAYVANVTQVGRDASIIRSIVELGRGFNLHMIAECVEEAKALPILQELGCHSAPGYSIGRPMAPVEFDCWRRSWITEQLLASRGLAS